MCCFALALWVARPCIQLVEDLIADERSSPTSPLASPSSSSSMDTGSRVIAHKGSRVALKETFSSLEMDDGGFDGFFNELTILSKLRHANIVQLLGTYESVAHRRGFLVSVYADNGPLSKYYRKSFEEVTFAKRRKWTLHVAQALAYVNVSLHPLFDAHFSVGVQYGCK